MASLVVGLLLVLPRPAAAQAVTEIVVATVNNAHMLQMQRLTPQFERANPDIRVKWITLEEGALRQRVTQDAASGAGGLDVMTVGLYEAQVWGRKGWLRPLALPASWDADDLLPPIREGLSIDGRLYAAPFYGESSLLMVRSDLAEKAGVVFKDRPSWAQVRDAAARLHQPDQGIYGLCLRGKPGWGENMTLLTTIVNSHGGQWFDMRWRPQLDSKPWRDAVGLYVDLMKRYGPPAAAANGYNELLALFKAGRCAMWVDASIALSSLSNPEESRVAGRVSAYQAPSAVTPKGANWLWSWSLAVPTASKHPAQALRFIDWATNKAYLAQVGQQVGWSAVPTGTRKSLYANPAFMHAAPFAAAERTAINSVNQGDFTLPRSPYAGVQFVAIPEFPSIGIAVGEQIAAAVSGKVSVEQALRASQQAADRAMRDAGYYRETPEERAEPVPRSGAKPAR